jgi:hypothetical protein
MPGADGVGALAIIDQALRRRVVHHVQADGIAAARRSPPGEDTHSRQQAGDEPFLSHGYALLLKMNTRPLPRLAPMCDLRNASAFIYSTEFARRASNAPRD